MGNFAYFYIEANIVCIIISLILIISTIKNVDKQLRQVEFVKTVILYIVLFLFDILWVCFEAEIIVSSYLIKHIIYFQLFIVFGFCSYQWFIYSEVVQGNVTIFTKKTRILWMIPLLLMILVFLIYTVYYAIGEVNHNFNFYIFVLHKIMVIICFLYGIISSVKSFVRACKKSNYLDKGLLVLMGMYPIVLMIALVLQMNCFHVPILCFLSTIIMLLYYFVCIDKQISIDPLTKLNNRNQLKKYFHNLQRSNGNENYLLIADIDKFKNINDVFGHMEGDNALKLVAQTFTEVADEYGNEILVSRYGGDEFVIIASGKTPEDIQELKNSLKKKIMLNGLKEQLPYNLSVSIGVSKILEKNGSLDKCIAESDEELYKEKKKKNHK